MGEIDIRRAKHAKSGLHDLCKYLSQFISLNKSTIIEIGAFAGQSAEIFSSYFEKVISIDMWESGYDPTGVDKASDPTFYDMKDVEKQFDILCASHPNIRKIKNSSEKATEFFSNRSIDVIYVDALHTYEGVKKDIRLWLPKIKKGGFICGHDFQSKHFPGVAKAVLEVFGEPEKRFADSSWVKRVDE